MTEREPTRRPWNVETITNFLNTPPEPMEDIAFGSGLRFRLGSTAASTSVELFASASAARLTTQDTQLTLRRLGPPQVDGERLLFAPKVAGEHAHHAALNAAGDMTLSPTTGSPAAEARNDDSVKQGSRREHSSREAPLEQAIRMLVDALDRCGGDEPSCPHCGPARDFAAGLLRPSDATAAPPEAERERLTLTGRVGAAVSFRTTRNGVLTGRFPVAVHTDDGGTAWETVVVFGAKAERLRGTLQKGQVVEVVGYGHDREVPKKDGSVRTVHEIYGAVIRVR